MSRCLAALLLAVAVPAGGYGVLRSVEGQRVPLLRKGFGELLPYEVHVHDSITGN